MNFHWQCPNCRDYLGDERNAQPYCDTCKRHGKMRFSEPSEVTNLRAILAEARAQLADAVAFVRKAGHQAGCEADRCQRCGYLQGSGLHAAEYPRYADEHLFHPVPCTCGYDKVVSV